MYYVVHPQHGRMPVADMGEVERVKKFGWVLEVPKPAEPKRGPGRPAKAK